MRPAAIATAWVLVVWAVITVASSDIARAASQLVANAIGGPQ